MEKTKREREVKNKMKKMLLAPLAVCMVALLSTLLLPAVHATKPITASGIWSWTVIPYGRREADGNIFVSAGETDTFTGTFTGTGYGEFQVVVHPEGFKTGHGQDLFTGTVLGKSGAFVIRWAGNTNNDLGWWDFMWVIMDGTGELANIRGQGTAWGPGPVGVDYSGQIVLAPD